MPKASKAGSSKSTLKAASSKPAAKTASALAQQRTQPVSSGKGKSTVPRLYSNFIPIAISIPSPIPIPSASSSSSKILTQTTHYIYARPHKASATSLEESTGAEDDSGRKVFVTNLPVDITEKDLRTIFARFGVIEGIELGRGGSENVLEQAVKGLPIDEDEDEDEDDDEEEEEGELEDGKGKDAVTESGEGDQVDSHPELRFVAGEKPKLPRSQRPRKKPQLPTSVPDIIPLPSSNPRLNPFGHSGSHIAYITFLDSISISRVMSHPTDSSSAISLPKYGDTNNPTGLEYYTSLHSSLRPPLDSIKQFADSSMARYDHLHSLLLSSRAKARGAGALVDEDGFTVVVRGAKFGRTGGRSDGLGGLGVGVASKGFGGAKSAGQSGGVAQGGKKKGIGGGELMDFYRFQKVDRKRQGESSASALWIDWWEGQIAAVLPHESLVLRLAFLELYTDLMPLHVRRNVDADIRTCRSTLEVRTRQSQSRRAQTRQAVQAVLGHGIAESCNTAEHRLLCTCTCDLYCMMHTA